MKMVEIIANLELYSGENKRKGFFQSDYRPLFDIENKRYSGAITLINKEKFYPGEKDKVIIRFVSIDFPLKELKNNLYVEFYEATEPLGKIEYLNEINLNDVDFQSMPTKT
jgi:hypothetical protein